MPRVLIGCETSGIVRNAFLAVGCDAWSCDLLPSDDRSNRHITGDIREVMQGRWDLMAVMHPPCTRLCNSGVRWLTRPPARSQPSRDVARAGRRGRAVLGSLEQPLTSPAAPSRTR